MAKTPKKGSSKSKGKPKKPSATKGKALAADYNKKAALVLGETAFATGRGIEQGMKADGRPFVLNDNARDFWVDYHLKSIPKGLLKKPDWDTQRTAVTLMATMLGAKAAEYALADAGASIVVQVTLAHVKAASAAIKGDRRCRAAARGGQGVYCESS